MSAGTRLSLDDIKAMIGERADEIVRQHLTDAKLKGTKWLARNPNRSDRHAGSFWVYGSKSPKAGGFTDYASGDSGSALDLVAFVKHGILKPDAATAINLSKQYLGLQHGAVDQAWLDAERRKVAVRTADMEARQKREAETQAQRASQIFLGAVAITGTPAQLYIEGARGVPLASLPHMPGALRFSPSEANWEEKRGADGFPKFPAMIAAMSRWNTPIAAVQRTYLKADGTKADVAKAKLIYPSSIGAAIRLSKGISNVSPEVADARGIRGETLILCEGAEDGLTCMMARPDARVWAVCGVTNLQHMQVPPSVEHIIVAADNDWQGSAARQALNNGLMALKEQRRSVSVVFSGVGKDFNDWLRG
jgi:hypothetical protein